MLDIFVIFSDSTRDIEIGVSTIDLQPNEVSDPGDISGTLAVPNSGVRTFY